MKRKNATRNALVTSIISLLLCVSMLVGTTFAWFTDSVVSARNVIAAGNLDVELYNDDGPVTSDTILFEIENNELWEPGVVAYENLQVRNVGTLALQYNLDLTVLNETVVNGYKLSDVIKVGVVENGVTGDRAAVIEAVQGNWTKLSEFNLNMSGKTLAAKTDDTKYGIVLYWMPDTDYSDGNTDNNYNMNNGETGVLQLDIGVNLTATQVEAESDSFNNTYDAGATLTTTTSASVRNDGSVTLSVVNAPSATTQQTIVEASAGAFADTAETVEIKVTTENTLFNVNSEGAVVASLGVTLYVDGVETSEELPEGALYTVTTYVSTGLSDVSVEYTGADDKDQPTLVSYVAETGKLVFTTNHFSEYTVSGKAYGYDIATDTAYATAQDVIDAIVAGNDPTVPVEDKQTVKDAAAGTKDHNTVIKAVSAVQNTTTNKWYISLDKALEAIESGNHTLKLLEDIDTTSSFDIPAGTTITLDMNGMTITATDTETNKNYELFNMECLSGGKSTMTVKGNGTIVLTATTDRDWNSMSTIFHNRGGELNIENGTFIHKGGTDMAYVVDNSTNWIGTGNTATLNVKGGKLESSYTAIRNRLDNTNNSGHGIVNISGGEIIGASRGIWAQLSSKPGSGEINVSGGTITGGKNAIRVDSDDTGASTVSVNVNNATINGEVVPGCASYVVNGVAYVSSADGLKAALAAGNPEIKLDSDIVLADDEVLKVTGNTVIDLNGHTISGKSTTSTTSYMINVASGAELTLSGNGKVSFYATTPDTEWGGEGQPPFPGYANNTIRCEGTLIIDGVTVENLTAPGGASYAIDCYQGSDLIVNSGVINGHGKCAIRMFCNSNTLSTNVTINGGTITGKRAIWVQLPGSNIANVRPVNLTINGGKLICTNTEKDVCVYSYSYGDSFANTNITITGGEFFGDVCFGGGNAKTTQENVSVTGGTFYGELGRYVTDDGTNGGWEDIAKP